MPAAAGVWMHGCTEPNDTHLPAIGHVQPDTKSLTQDRWPMTLWHFNVTALVSIAPPLIVLFEFEPSFNETSVS